jgi:hypothetical protein
MLLLLPPASAGLLFGLLFTLKVKVMYFSKALDSLRNTRRCNTKYSKLHSHCREIRKSSELTLFTTTLRKN